MPFHSLGRTVRTRNSARPTASQCLGGVLALVSAAVFIVVIIPAVVPALAGGFGAGMMHTVTAFIGRHWQPIGVTAGALLVFGLALVVFADTSADERPTSNK